MDTIPNITHLIGQGPTDDEVEEPRSPIMNEDYKSFQLDTEMSSTTG